MIVTISVFSQKGTITLNVNQNSIIITHNKYVQCAATFKTDIYFIGETINIFEEDTSLGDADCLCIFDVTTTIDSVNNGNYSIFYYCVSHITTDTSLCHTFQCVVNSNFNGTITKTTSQSNCLNEIKNIDLVNESYLRQNIPNPFSTTTTIEFEIPDNNGAKLKIFDSKGQVLKSIDFFQKGKSKFIWDKTDISGRNVNEGIYYYTLTTSKKCETKKMIVLK